MSDTIADGRAPSKKKKPQYTPYNPRPLENREVAAADLRLRDDEGNLETVQDVLDRYHLGAYDSLRNTDAPKPKLGYLEFLSVKFRAMGLTTAETVRRIARDGYHVTDRWVRESWRRFVDWMPPEDRRRLVPPRFGGHRVPERFDVCAYVDYFPPGPELAAQYIEQPYMRRSQPEPQGDWLAAPRADTGVCGNCVECSPVTLWRHRRDPSGVWIEVPLCSRCSAWKRAL